MFLVDDRAAIDEILAEDPYYTGPGVTVASIQEWNPVICHPALDGCDPAVTRGEAAVIERGT